MDGRGVSSVGEDNEEGSLAVSEASGRATSPTSDDAGWSGTLGTISSMDGKG